MRNGTVCILSQLYGSYDEGLNNLGISGELSALEDLPISYLETFFESARDRNGLVFHSPVDGNFRARDIYDILDELWQEELEGVKYEGQNPELLDYGY